MSRNNSDILVNLSPQDTVDTAILTHARTLAQTLGSSIHLFCSDYKPAHKKQLNELRPRQLKFEAHVVVSAKHYLERCSEILCSENFNTTSTFNWKKPFETALLEAIQKYQPKYILSHRPPSTWLDRLAASDAAWQLTKITDVPVIFVGATAQQKVTNQVWAAVDPMAKHAAHIQLNELIIENAKQLASGDPSNIRLIHCYGSSLQVAEIAIGLSSSEYLPVLDKDEEYNKHNNRLYELAERHEIPSANVHILPGLAQVVLPLVISRNSPRVVVVGANNKGRLEHLIYGSTAKKLLHRAESALCVVRIPVKSHQPAQSTTA